MAGSPSPRSKKLKKQKTVGVSIVELHKLADNKDQPKDNFKFDYNYSCGSNGDCAESLYDIQYSLLPENEKQKRVIRLWELTFKRLRGATIIVRKLYENNDKIFNAGFNQKKHLRYTNLVGDEVTAQEISEESGHEQAPTCIIMPDNLYR